MPDNKNIDQLFKDSYDGRDIGGYGEEHWAQLETQLNAAAATTAGVLGVKAVIKSLLAKKAVLISLVTLPVVGTTTYVVWPETPTETTGEQAAGDWFPSGQMATLPIEKQEEKGEEPQAEAESIEGNALQKKQKAEVQPSSATVGQVEAFDYSSAEQGQAEALPSPTPTNSSDNPVSQEEAGSIKEPAEVASKANQEADLEQLPASSSQNQETSNSTPPGNFDIANQDLQHAPVSNNAVATTPSEPEIKEEVAGQVADEFNPQEVSSDERNTEATIEKQEERTTIALMESLPLRSATRDLDPVTAAEGDLPPLSPSRIWYQRFYVVGGVGLSKGFSNGPNSEKNEVISPIVGLGYMQPLAPGWELSVGAQYLQRNGHSLEDSISETIYYLTPTRYTSVNTIQDMEFLHFPLSVSFNPSGNHKFTLGGFATLLLDSWSTIEEREQGILTSGYSKQERVRGYREGISEMSYGISLGYEYQLLERISVGFRYNRGLNDLTDDQVIRQSNKDQISEGQIIFKLRPF